MLSGTNPTYPTTQNHTIPIEGDRLKVSLEGVRGFRVSAPPIEVQVGTDSSGDPIIGPAYPALYWTIADTNETPVPYPNDTWQEVPPQTVGSHGDFDIPFPADKSLYVSADMHNAKVKVTLLY